MQKEDTLKKAVRVDFGQLAEDDPRRVIAQQRLGYVRAVLAAGPRRWDAVALEPLIAAVPVTAPTRPSWRAVRRWAQAYEAAGCDIAALVPSYEARGNRQAKMSGKALAHYDESAYAKAQAVAVLLEQAIQTHYLQTQRLTVRAVYEKLATAILQENRGRAPHDQLPLPHPSTLYRRVAKLDAYERMQTRYGAKYAQARFGVNPQPPVITQAIRPLARVECDHTHLDLFVVDEKTRLPLGRPWLTALLDVCTRMVCGIYLSFAAPGYASVMQALRHAIRPKDYLQQRYPKLQHAWPVQGVPETLVVDNGMEFHSRHLTDTCAQLGIELKHAPPQCGWYKGSLERWFGTQNTKLLHELPGTTFSNVTQRGDYDAQRHAVISFLALLEMIHLWIVDLYHQQFQRGLGALPAQAWRNAVATHPPRPCARLAELEILTGCAAERRIGRAGIELFALHYHAAELARLRRELLVGAKAKLKYDPTDLSVIYVFDAAEQRYLPAAAVESAYTQGLTLHQHEVIRRHARQTAQAPVDAAALSEAREQIAEIVARERATAPTLTRRTRAARLHDWLPGSAAQAAPGPPLTEATSLPVQPALAASAETALLAETEGWSVSYDLTTAWHEVVQ